MISTILYLKTMSALSGTGTAMSKPLGKASSLMCRKKDDGAVIVETPGRKVKEIFKAAGVKIPTSFKLEDFEADYLLKPTPRQQK